MAQQRFARIALGVDVGIDKGRTQKQFLRDKYLDSTMVTDELVAGSLAASGSLAVGFGQIVTARLVYIEAFAPLEVRFNGVPAGPVLTTLPAAQMPGVPTPPARIVIESPITSLTIVNPSSTVAVDYLVYMAG